MTCAFTIVTKSYIALANILGDSLKASNDSIEFFIVVADEEDGLIDFSNQLYPIIKASDLKIDNIHELAFKYNITEFCTALKPFAIKHFFDVGYQNTLYFDPDIYVFSSLTSIIDNLKDYSMILTPHFCTPEVNYSGLFREGNILFAGIYNLGFCAISNTYDSQLILNWWSNRLYNLCYADRIDGLHVDQKWADFLPTLFSGVFIEKNIGYNVAIWNWHERKIHLGNDNNYYVSNRLRGEEKQRLIFYHFSNYHFRNAENFDKFLPIKLEKYNDIFALSNFYAELIIKYHFIDRYSILPYTFATFNNGVPITNFHRRMYRRIVDQKMYNFEITPFSTDKNLKTFYSSIVKKKLISKNNIDKLNEMNFNSFNRKLNIIRFLSKLLQYIIGFDKYTLLCKFASRYVRAENQTFLIHNNSETIPFENENRYINVQ